MKLEQFDAGRRSRSASPTYDRDEIGIGIVHFGVGGFHRAHQAMYVDRLLERGQRQEWGICGVGVMPADSQDGRRPGRAGRPLHADR